MTIESRIRVPGEGSKTSPLVIVGEAPGYNEEKEGRPFVGPAGQLLDKLLHSVGQLRRDTYVTNVVKEKPRNNNIEDFILMGKPTKDKAREAFVDGTPKTEGHSKLYQEYEDMLIEEINQCSATTVVACGAVAAWALCRMHGITKIRGSVYTDPRIPGKKIIPCIHPAAALRLYLYEHYIRFDLGRAVEQSKTAELPYKSRRIRLSPTFDEAIHYLDGCAVCEEVGFDIEVSRTTKRMTCFSLSQSPTDVMSIPLVDHTGDYFVVAQEAEILRALAILMESKRLVKIGQNVTGFDGPYLLREYGIMMRNVQDTMVGMGVLYPDFPKGLDFIASIFTMEPYYKDDGKMFIKLDGGSFEGFWRYNALDSAVTHEAWAGIIQDLQSTGNYDTYRRQMRTYEPMTFAGYRGIKADVEGLAAASFDCNVSLESLQAKLNELVGYDINPNSPKQIKDYFYKEKGERPYRSRTGTETVDETALKRLSRKGYEEAAVILQMRGLRKEKGTYFDMKLDADNRVRAQFNIIGTKTGRAASRKTIWETGGNMQNLTPTFKKYLVADDDCIAYELDLSQAENRIVAYYGPEPQMIEAFETGQDVHALTAALIFGIDISEVSDKKGSSPLGGGKLSQRDWGKRTNHSLNYGLGYKQFALRYEIPEVEAKRLRDAYYAVYPGVTQYQNRIKNALRKARCVTNLLGRIRYFADRWGNDLFQEAYAQVPQSTVADIINQHGVTYVYERQELFRPVELLNQVHDSIWIQIRGTDWEHHAQILLAIKQSMEVELRASAGKFVIPVEAKGGKRFGLLSKLPLDAPANLPGAISSCESSTIG